MDGRDQATKTQSLPVLKSGYTTDRFFPLLAGLERRPRPTPFSFACPSRLPLPAAGLDEELRQPRRIDRLDQVGVEAGLEGAAPVFVLAVAGQGDQVRQPGAVRG